MSTEIEMLIRKTARARGLSIAEVARRAGLSRQSLYSICSCASSPNLHNIVGLARALDLEPMQLVEAYLQSIYSAK